MENLQSDIVLKILSRLPKTNTGFKSGLQCREVCRLWRNLLGKPKKGMLFVSQLRYGCDTKLYYRENSSEMVNFNCIEEPQKFYNMVTEISSTETGLWLFSFVGTCNGLVCYVISKFIYIYNPITGERIRIPNIGSASSPVGFGYCRSTKTYKVVMIGENTAVKIGQSTVVKQSVKVYTLGDGSGWRCRPYVTYMLSGPGVFANGALHWSSNCDVVAFDLADETFRCLPSPPCGAKSDRDVNVGSCGANLYLSHYYMKQGEGMMDIWVFEKKNMNNCRRSLKERTYFNSFTWIRRFSRKWDQGLTHLLFRTESEILLLQKNVLSCYDPPTFKKIWSAEAAEGVYQAVPHMHSLVSLKDLGEERVDHFVLPKMVLCV